MNTFLMIIGIVLLCVIGYVGFATYSLFITVDNINYCDIDSDCVLVDSDDACPQTTAINHDQERAWQRKLKYAKWLYDIVQLEQCSSKIDTGYEVVCKNNECLARRQ